MSKVTLFLFAAVALGQGAPVSASGPLNPAQREQITCVAALAIVASEQQRGVPAAAEWPPLGERGARFAQVTGERLMADAGITKEAVRDAIVAAVAAHQKAANENGALKELPRELVQGCVVLMDRLTPEPDPPTLPQCAAMLALAQESPDVGDARDLKTLASVLDHRAREALRASGKSGTEIDQEMTLTREAIMAEVGKREADGVSAGIDYGACLEMAKP